MKFIQMTNDFGYCYTRCVECHKVFRVPMTVKQWSQYVDGKTPIQNILPDVEPELRELLVNDTSGHLHGKYRGGHCKDCWEAKE